MLNVTDVTLSGLEHLHGNPHSRCSLVGLMEPGVVPSVLPTWTTKMCVLLHFSLYVCFPLSAIAIGVSAVSSICSRLPQLTNVCPSLVDQGRLQFSESCCSRCCCWGGSSRNAAEWKPLRFAGDDMQASRPPCCRHGCSRTRSGHLTTLPTLRDCLQRASQNNWQCTFINISVNVPESVVPNLRFSWCLFSFCKWPLMWLLSLWLFHVSTVVMLVAEEAASDKPKWRVCYCIYSWHCVFVWAAKMCV